MYYSFHEFLIPFSSTLTLQDTVFSLTLLYHVSLLRSALQFKNIIFWLTILSVTPLAQCVICLSSVCLSVCRL